VLAVRSPFETKELLNAAAPVLRFFRRRGKKRKR